MKRILVLIVVALLLSIFVYSTPAVVGNEGQCGYNPPPPDCYGGDKGQATPMAFNPIEYYIIQGAYFFEISRSVWAMFESQYELGFFSLELLGDVKREIENTVNMYAILAELTCGTPYNDNFIQGLKSFNYDVFAENFNLNKDIFNELKGLLQEGDLTGFYLELLRKASKISETLRDVEPNNLEAIWNVSSQIAQFELFGQYGSRVFYALK